MISNKPENWWRLLYKYTFEIDHSILIDFSCVICDTVVKDCRQSPCGCRYCYKCISDYLKDEEKCCPGNSNDCKDIFLNLSIDLQVDHVANIKIGRMHVKCPYQDCTYGDELRKIESHINSHILSCPYSEVGCDVNPLNCINIEDHLKAAELPHAKFLINSLLMLRHDLEMINVENQNKANIVHELQEQLKNMKNTNSKQSNLVEKLNVEISYLANEINLLRKINQHKEESRKELESQVNLAIVGLDNKFLKLNDQIHQMQAEDRVEIVPEIPQEVSSFTWKVSNFSIKRKHAQNNFERSLQSHPFYSHKNGYKLCLEIWPDGSLATGYKYMSVGFRLMKGEFDNALSWPMQLTVTIAIMDQESNSKYKEEKYSYESSPNQYKHCFHRPTTIFNKTRSSVSFINLDQLSSNYRLLMNDTIILYCYVK